MVATDYRPLEAVFKKDIFEVPNPRLPRICEKFAEYNMVVKWVPGKSHHIVDAVSRAPLFAGPADEDNELAIGTTRTCLTQVVEKNPELKIILNGLGCRLY